MARKELAVDNVAEAYLALLAERGIEYLFANAGTDFAPLVEAFAKAARTGTPVPQPVLATHENLAFSMAHGYAMVSRRVPAVIGHVSVGTAHRVYGALNAARENVPPLFTPRSPQAPGETSRRRYLSQSSVGLSRPRPCSFARVTCAYPPTIHVISAMMRDPISTVPTRSSSSSAMSRGSRASRHRGPNAESF